MKEPWRISAASPVSIEEAKLVSQLAARARSHRPVCPCLVRSDDLNI